MKGGLVFSVAFIFGIILIASSGFASAGLFTGKVVLNSDGWTPWLDRDNPSGSGDWETLTDFINSGDSCKEPSKIEWRAVNGEKILQTIHVNEQNGFYCLNSENPEGCLDYEVRFYCGKPKPEPICGNGICETGEECDTGNPSDSDGCSYFCKTLEGWDCTCTSGGSVCEEIPECYYDYDCPNNQRCEYGECVPIEECYYDYDCPNNQRCEYGECVPIEECYYDYDCPNNQRCVDGMCVEDCDCVYDSNCPYNAVCVDCQCVEITYDCTDSDGGVNYYEKGHLVDELHNADYYDVCMDEDSLREYSCGSENYQYHLYTCPGGCESGACLPGPVCGNRIQETGEQCDGNAWAVSASCEYFGYDSGTLSCNDDCTFDFSDCIVESNQCTDSDGGINYYEKGHLIDSAHNADYHDFCLDSSGTVVYSGSTLREHYCGDNNYKYKYYECLNGCVDGRCVEETDEQFICNDSDGGINYYLKGEVRVLDTTSGLLNVSIDYCENSILLKENYCVGGNLNQVSRDCAMEGKICVNGACVKEGWECTDSDGGLNYYVKGYRINNNPSYFSYGIKEEDFCIFNPNFSSSGTSVISDQEKKVSSCDGDKCYVIEYKCVSDLSDAHEGYKCPNGCVDGACALNDSYSYCVGGACILFEGDVVYPSVEGKNFSIEIEFIGDNAVKFGVNGVVTNSLEEGQSYVLGDIKITAKDILFTSKNDGLSKVSFVVEKYSQEECITDWNCEETQQCINGVCVEKSVEIKCYSNNDCYSGYVCIDGKCIKSEDESCQYGCFVKGNCYPLGYRKSGEYCTEKNSFVNQLSEDEPCDNNFECSSNLCIDGECISGSLIRKILDFFRNLFS